MKAEKALEQFKNFPDLFVKPISVVDHEEKVYLAVELFEAIKYKKKPSEERNKLLKYKFFLLSSMF
uniref:Uncharacterized protein n=1 Tax=Daucus carota subsp. sativus TaxID=79200 RepID=A0A166H338_DAUCS